MRYWHLWYLIKELQERSKDIGVSLVHLIKEDHGVWTLTKARGELTSLIVADVARGSTNQLGHLQVVSRADLTTLNKKIQWLITCGNH